MLQVVSMVVEAATGRSRSRTKTIVASPTMFVVIMLELSFFGPTQAPFSRLFSQLVGWIVLALACYQTHLEPIPAIEMSLMVILYTVNGAAFLMMTPAALVFANIFMGVMILAYGLFFELPVVGLPVFYLLTLYCQSNAPASPMAIGNSLTNQDLGIDTGEKGYVYCCSLFCFYICWSFIYWWCYHQV